MSAPTNLASNLVCPICKEILRWTGSKWLHADGSGMDEEGNYICTKFNEYEMFAGAEQRGTE